MTAYGRLRIGANIVVYEAKKNAEQDSGITEYLRGTGEGSCVGQPDRHLPRLRNCIGAVDAGHSRLSTVEKPE